jgi:flagellar motor switch/type III secretory pathway protein FliN
MAETTPDNSTDPGNEVPPLSPADIAGMAISEAGVHEKADLIGASIPVGSETGLSEGPLRGPAASSEIDLSHLPAHTRSLLRIPVTVRVTLARQRRPVSEIMELGPGTLVKFEKTYDKPLELSIGELPIAEGEAVKVGDKFGLRIGQIIRPHERFKSVG